MYEWPLNNQLKCVQFDYLKAIHTKFKGFPGGSDGKAFACNAGDLGLTPSLGRSPGEGNGYLLEYSCLENPMDRGAWWATVHGIAMSQTRLTDLHFHSHIYL